jgi:hypothetical protein
MLNGSKVLYLILGGGNATNILSTQNQMTVLLVEEAPNASLEMATHTMGS